MSLKKKIALSFLISSAIIAILAAFDYLSFWEIKKEIRYLEITDTISRKSLQLRRHEKIFFRQGRKENEESAIVYSYVAELKKLLFENPQIDATDALSFRSSIRDYERRFVMIETTAQRLTKLFDQAKKNYKKNARFLSIVEATFLDHPARSADFLENLFFLPRDHDLVSGLRQLDADITALRKTGDDILVISKDLDKIAREKAETVIRVSQTAILILFPLFFIVGIGSLFFISANMAKRLVLLINLVEKTGKGSYPHLSVPPAGRKADDEVGVLIEKFNDMEDQLAEREAELKRKNKELIQTRKLAAIGTLASGVAHELNNPLNNISLSAQVLSKEAGDGCSPELSEAVRDILSQTERVKGIVGDLLEFARGRDPQISEIELLGIIKQSFRHTGSIRDLERITFSLDAGMPQVFVFADQGQLEQVFNNLFKNAVDAMQWQGNLSVVVTTTEEVVMIRVSDTGRGIPQDSVDKIFEPFFTTKDKGTGLGLAIVYNIIKKHYGEISVESGETGTTFAITLPSKRI